MASKWNVDKKQERNKLLSTEDDWNLAGSGKVSGRRVRKPRKFLGIQALMMTIAIQRRVAAAAAAVMKRKA